MKIIHNIIFPVFLWIVIAGNSQASEKKNKQPVFDTIKTNITGKGIEMTFILEKGKSHNHPTLAIWIEDLQGSYIQPIYVTKYIATGIFGFGPVNDSLWGNKPGEAYRPAALPYWNHKRIRQPEIKKIMPEKNNPIPDAYTSATPTGSFILNSKTDNLMDDPFKILIEVNQTWDWNEYWTNDKYREDIHYKSSSQPSVIYSVTIDPNDKIKEYWLNPIGHGHYSGKDGNLYTDLSTLTTALKIFKSIKVIFR